MSTDMRVALVTGASRGIGASILTTLAKQGFAVHGTATSDVGAQRITQTLTAGDWHGAGHVWQATASDSDNGLFKELAAVDVLVCNAGVTHDNLLMRMKDEHIADVLQVNLVAPFRLARHYMRTMLRKRTGRIIMLSSVIASVGNAGQSNYAASKAGLEGLVRSLARELGGRGVTVNAVAPGYIDTDMTAAVLTDEVKDKLLGQIPLGRVGTPNDVAAAVAFLVSPQAGYITGITLAVNGGMLMG